MADIGILPKNWKDTAAICSQPESIEFKKLGPGVWIDDDCPMQMLIIVVDENREVFRLTDPATIQLVFCSLKTPEALRKIYSAQNLPKIKELTHPPSLN
jgi:hypothetical protein